MMGFDNRSKEMDRAIRSRRQWRWARMGLVIALALIVLPSCTLAPRRPETVTAETTLIRLTASQYPKFSDDLDWDNLETAIGQSLTYLERLPGDTPFVFGPDTVTANHLAASLAHFRSFIRSRPDPASLQNFIADQYIVYRSIAGTEGEMLFTGYYEPLLRGSLTQSPRYPFPVYGRPDDLVTVELFRFSPEFKTRQLMARLENGRVIPYYDREQIEMAAALDGKAGVLVWVDDATDLFFLHIQGSGRVILDTGETLNIQYNTTNGRPYRSVGKVLIDKGAIAREDMSMQAIRRWLSDHPEQATGIFHTNPSYVFFKTGPDGPFGSINVRLTPGRSMATDYRLFPKGALAFIQTAKPVVDGGGQILEWTPLNRFTLNQDTGGAIRGPGRADIFWGNGPYAEIAAGYMQHPGTLYFIVLKAPS
ncbi:MAG: MltA domain-containing protein [Pseudomonadota bacterium]